MKRYRVIWLLAVHLALSTALSACSEAPGQSAVSSTAPAVIQRVTHRPFHLKAEAIDQVTVESITLATPGEVNAIIDRPVDIAELLDILNDARPYSGAAPADLYGVFTFSKTDSSETVLEFSEAVSFLQIKVQENHTSSTRKRNFNLTNLSID